MRTDNDTVDRMIREWGERDAGLDVSVLEVVGRLLLGANHLERAIADALRPLGLSYGDFDVINTLRRRNVAGGLNPGELARSLLITTGAMTSRLDRLERMGLIKRRADPADRRGVLVQLTRKGERLAERALAAVLAVDEEFLEPLGRRDRELLAAALKRLVLRYEAG